MLLRPGACGKLHRRRADSHQAGRPQPSGKHVQAVPGAGQRSAPQLRREVALVGLGDAVLCVTPGKQDEQSSARHHMSPWAAAQDLCGEALPRRVGWHFMPADEHE